MGVSVENRRFLHRLDTLRQIPAAVRFTSCEPLLGPLHDIDLDRDRLAHRGWGVGARAHGP